MRAFLTSLMAFFLSGLAGGVVAQQLAVWTGAGEEYILAFMAVALVAIVATVVFFIAQLVSEPRRGARLTAMVLLGLFAVAGVGLVAWTLSVPANQQAASSDMKVIAGLILPGMTIILVQWLFIAWRAPGRLD